MGLTSALYRLARLSADLRALRTPASAARSTTGLGSLWPARGYGLQLPGL